MLVDGRRWDVLSAWHGRMSGKINVRRKKYINLFFGFFVNNSVDRGYVQCPSGCVEYFIGPTSGNERHVWIQRVFFKMFGRMQCVIKQKKVVLSGGGKDMSHEFVGVFANTGFDLVKQSAQIDADVHMS
jgi:hypothetical protein